MAFSEDRATLMPWSADKEFVPAPNSPATAAALAVVFGSYWDFRPEATQTRRRHPG